MNEGYVPIPICDLKHKEVDDMKESLMKLQDTQVRLMDCINGKFTTLWFGIGAILASIITVLLAVVLRK